MAPAFLAKLHDQSGLPGLGRGHASLREPITSLILNH